MTFLKFFYIVICVTNYIQANILSGLNLNELYSDHDEVSITILPHGDSAYDFIKLETPIHFFSEKYDHIYINTNGILTFITEFPEYLNQPFPLEYPSIAPFYSNVDTTGANDSTAIVFFKSQNIDKLDKASQMIKKAFRETYDFQATALYVATWKNVGYFKENHDKLNTFQVVIICDEDQTFVQFIYPKNGINWLQADVGELGLPDIRAQVGFISEDGRYFTLNGSGTDNVRYLSTLSTIDVPGVWLYHVGPLDFYEKVNKPDNIEVSENLYTPSTCESGLYQKCHSSAVCINKSWGKFCCRCNEGYYGNGFNCIKSTVPLRVIGHLTGTINNQPVNSNSKLQSYVVMADGRAYTAINPVSSEFGQQLAMALPLGGAIGWLFAKPMGSTLNGYQITGGKLNHLSTIRFRETGQVFVINQTFEGLNYWDQLSVKIDVSGELPYIPIGSRLQANDYLEEYNYSDDTKISSRATVKIHIPSENRNIEYDLTQIITFQVCRLDSEDSLYFDEIVQKVSKITIDYRDQEQAIRIAMLTKIGVDPESNPCTDGTAICGGNTVCVPHGDSYDCICKNGYAPDVSDTGIEHCVDIDECHGSNICDDNAHCKNIAGGYTCSCYEGYTGNGHECHYIRTTTDGYDYSIPTSTDQPYDYTTNFVDYEATTCQRCSPEALCINNVCTCKDGWSGDGYYCISNCHTDEVWTGYRCQSARISEESDVTSNCRPDEIWTGYKCQLARDFGEPVATPNCRPDEVWTGYKCQPSRILEEPDATPYCPEGYEYFEDCRPNSEDSSDSKQEEQIPCDVEFNCHENATCEWSEQELRHICVCFRGYEGDGFNCTKIDISCATKRDLCDVHASCLYDENLRKSQCKCDPGYDGDGFTCQLAPECIRNEDCGQNAYCERGICLCLQGFQRDLADFCVPSDTCGGTYCADNAICKWEPIQKLQYCECLDGYVGDGVISCKSTPPSCNVRNNCGLYASCIPIYGDYAKYECVCNPGYYGDGYVCVEEKNCRNTPSMCDKNAKCTTTAVGLQCICETGFFGNGSFCREITTHESGFLLISQGVVIIRIPFSGKLGRPISVAQMAIGLDKDCVEGRIYWGDISAKKIMSSKYDGTDSKSFITTDVQSPEGIAVDWVSRRLYWTDSTKDTIEVANLDNPNQRAILINKHLVNPRGIAVDPYKNKLYWSDWNRDAPKIEMSDLDGTGREILLTKPDVLLPNSLVVLRNSGELCFADAGTKKIECVDTYSRAVRPIASNLSYPFGLTSTDEQFYWTDWTTKQIESVDVYGNRHQGMRTPVFGSHKMYGMTAVLESCPVTYSPCQVNNGGCTDERLCIVNPKSPSSKSCKCTRLSKLCNEISLEL